MFYLVSQFVPLILVALLIGVVVGWLIWGGADDEFDDAADGGDVSQARAEASRLSAQLRNREGEVTQLRTKLDELTNVHELRNGELDQARFAHTSALTTVNELQGRLASGGGGLPSEVPAEFVALRSSHDRALSEIEQLRAERSGLQARVAAGLGGDPGVAQDQANRISDLERSLAAERELGRTEVERARAQVEGARNASEQARALAEHAASELERLRKEFARSEGERADLASKLSNSASGDQVMALQEERDNALLELATVAGRLRDQVSAGEQRNTELEQAQRAADDARRALDDTRRAADEARAVPQAQLVSLQNTHEQFRAESVQAIANASTRAAAADAANSRLASDLAALRSSQENHVYELQRALSDERFRCDAAQTELGRLAAELAVLRATSGFAGTPASFASSYGAALFPPAGALPQSNPGPPQYSPNPPPSGYYAPAAPAPSPPISGYPPQGASYSAPTAPPASYYGPVPADNLEDLIGIGPVLARRLRDLGVTTFRQVGEWTDADVDRFQAYLSDFPDRIRRDNWVGGARQIWERRYGRPWAERTLVDGTRL